MAASVRIMTQRRYRRSGKGQGAWGTAGATFHKTDDGMPWSWARSFWVKTRSGERGARRRSLVDSQVVLPAFSSPGRGARHESERTQGRCVKELNLNPVIAVR